MNSPQASQSFSGDRFTACRVAMSLVATLASPSLSAADRTWVASPSGSNWSLPGNWGGIAPVANDGILFGSSSTVSLNNDLAANLVLSGITFHPGAGAFSFGGNAVNLNGAIANNSSNGQHIGFPIGLQATTVTVSGGSNVTISGKLTSGILGGAAGANRTLANNLTGGSLLILDAVDLSIDPDPSVRTLTISGSGDTMITGPIANGSSAGTANNKLTYAGTGTLTLNGATGSSYTGSTTINGGTLVLDFSNMATPVNLLGMSNLTAGSSVILKGKSGAATSQTFNGITAAGDRSSSFTVQQNGAASVDISLGGMTRNARSTMDFVLPAAGTVTTTSAPAVNGIATSSSNSAYQTVGGTTWLAKGGDGPFVLSAYPEASYSTTYAAANNVDVTDGDTAFGVTVNSLRFSGGPDKVLSLGGVNTVSTGGILVTPAATGSQIAGGTLRGNSNAGSRELLLINHGSLDVTSTIADNGSGSSLVIGGPGTTTLGGSNTFTGVVSITEGTTMLGISQAGAVSSALGIGGAGAPAVNIAQGATLDLNGFDQTVGTLASTPGTIRNDSGFPSALTVKNNSIQNGVIVSGGDISLISDVGSGNQYQLNSSLLTFGGTLVQRSGNLRSNTFQTDFGTSMILLDVLAAGAIGTNGTVGANNRFHLNSGTGSLPNDIEVVSHGFISQNATGRTLSGSISGAGVLNIIDGNDTLTGDNSGFMGTFNLWQSGAGILFNSTDSSSALARYTFSTEGISSGTSSYAANLPAGGTVNMGELSTTGATTNSQVRNNVNNTTATFSVGALDTDSTFGGVIANGSGTNQITALTKVGTGKLTLTSSSTYTGPTQVDGGTLAILSPRTLAAASAVTVGAAGAIGGTGIFAGPVDVAGTIAPGTGVGTLTTGPATLTGTLAVEVSGATADKLVSTGAIHLGSATLTVTELAAGTQASYVIAEGTSLSGTFATQNLPAGYSVSYNSTQALLNRAGGGSGYDSWKTLPANGLTAGVNDGPNQDPDLDGIVNLLEFVLGGVPAGAGASDTSILPVATLTPGALVLTFHRADPSEGDVTLKVQWSTDLVTWNASDEVTIGPGDSGIVDVTEDSPTAALDKIEVSIPRTEAVNGRLYARISVTRP